MGYTYPEGVANDIDNVPVYLQGIADEIIANSIRTSAMEVSSSDIRASEISGTVFINTETVPGLADYDVAKGFAAGAMTSKWKSYELRYDRGRMVAIDAVAGRNLIDYENAAAKLSKLVRQSVVPEIDMIRLAGAASAAMDGGVTEAYTPVAATVLGKLQDAINMVKDATNTEQGVKVYFSREYRPILSKSTEVTKMRDLANNVTVINSEVKGVDDAEIIYCPSSYMYSEVTAGNNGVTMGGSKVPFIVTAPDCALGVKIHETMNVYSKGSIATIDAAAFNYRVFHDLICPENRRVGIYAATIA